MAVVLMYMEDLSNYLGPYLVRRLGKGIFRVCFKSDIACGFIGCCERSYNWLKRRQLDAVAAEFVRRKVRI